MNILELKEIRTEGERAFTNGASANTNPYDKDILPIEYLAWAHGFNEALQWDYLIKLNEKY